MRLHKDGGLWYTSGIEAFISTMETSSLMGMNVARLIQREWEEEEIFEGEIPQIRKNPEDLNGDAPETTLEVENIPLAAQEPLNTPEDRDVIHQKSNTFPKMYKPCPTNVPLNTDLADLGSRYAKWLEGSEGGEFDWEGQEMGQGEQQDLK